MVKITGNENVSRFSDNFCEKRIDFILHQTNTKMIWICYDTHNVEYMISLTDSKGMSVFWKQFLANSSKTAHHFFSARQHNTVLCYVLYCAPVRPPSCRLECKLLTRSYVKA